MIRSFPSASVKIEVSLSISVGSLGTILGTVTRILRIIPDCWLNRSQGEVPLRRNRTDAGAYPGERLPKGRGCAAPATSRGDYSPRLSTPMRLLRLFEIVEAHVIEIALEHVRGRTTVSAG